MIWLYMAGYLLSNCLSILSTASQKNASTLETGEAMTENAGASFEEKLANLRVIPCRWVSAFKSESRVRCRIVGKDIRRGTSARSLGFSSPTPSIEALHCVLTLAANRNYRLCSMDVAHAFMHSPFRRGENICLRMPMSISYDDGSMVYLYLHRSLNGLRNASLHWLQLLAETIRSIGLWADEIEPCVHVTVPSNHIIIESSPSSSWRIIPLGK